MKTQGKRSLKYLASLITVSSFGVFASSNAMSEGFPAAGDFQKGAKIWAENCGRCHNIRGAEDMRNDQWITTMFHMRVRAGLTGQETRDVLTFLQTSNAPVTVAAIPDVNDTPESIIDSQPDSREAVSQEVLEKPPAIHLATKRSPQKQQLKKQAGKKIQLARQPAGEIKKTAGLSKVLPFKKLKKEKLSVKAPIEKRKSGVVKSEEITLATKLTVGKPQTTKTNNKPVISKSKNKAVKRTKEITVSTKLGKEIFMKTCVACHGADGKGALPGVPDFTQKGGRLAKSDTTLMNNISNGFKSPGSPMAMPPKGGNPNLSKSDIRAVLNYLRKAYAK